MKKVTADDPEMRSRARAMIEARAAERFPIGAKVRFYPIAGEDHFEEAEIRSRPWTLGHGAVVVAITGRAGGVSVDHLERVDA